jgi:hypothetical protein
MEPLQAGEAGGGLTVVARAMFSCVAENGASWFVKVQNLVLSIREFGGSQASAPIVVNFVEGVDPKFEQWLGGFDAEVRVVERYPGIRYANKLRMLELTNQDGFDVLVALDCDIVVLGDIREFLRPEFFLGKPVDIDVLTDHQWKTIFHGLGLAVPRRTVTTTTFGERTYPYFNGGMLLVPRRFCAPLFNMWSRFLHELEAVYASDPKLALRRKYNDYIHDQLALACALLAARIPVRPVPPKMDIPTHLNIHPAFLHELDDPRIVHYHTGLDDRGFLISSKYAALNRHLDRFNQRRAQLLGLPYEGLPPHPLSARLRQELGSQRWFHALAVQQMKAQVRDVLARTGLRSPHVTARRRSV